MYYAKSYPPQSINQHTYNLLKNLRPASPQKVAKYGYKKMMKNKVVAIYGFNNRLMIFAKRLVPRKFIRYIAYKIQSKRK